MILPDFFMRGVERFDLRSTAPVNPLEPNADGWRRYYVLPDFLSPLYGYQLRPVINPDHPAWKGDPPVDLLDGAPAVNRIGFKSDTESHNKTAFTRERQVFWGDVMAMHLYGLKFYECWPDQRLYVAGRIGVLMGPRLAFFNRSVNTFVRNYLNEENLDGEDPKFAPLICAGDTIWGMPEGGVVKVASFVIGMSLPPVTPQLLFDPRILWATNIDRQKTVTPFPQLHNGISVPYPLITTEEYYFPLAGLQEYSHDDPPRSQYLPPREVYP